jgi:hypothetical protein
LIDHVRTGGIRQGQTIVLLHTGATPALFAYAGDLASTEPPIWLVAAPPGDRD